MIDKISILSLIVLCLVNSVAAIIGGNSSTASYYASVHVHDNVKGVNICGGSIISNNFILTAASCLTGFTMHNVTVRVGSSTRNDGGTVHKLSDLLVHPRFDVVDNDFDMALLKTKNLIVLGPNVTIIAMPLDTDTTEKGSGTVIGLGVNKYIGTNAAYPPQLQSASIDIIANADCESYYGVLAPGSLVCAKKVNVTYCTGDSGGPLVLNNILIGVASQPEMANGKCSTAIPDRFSRVSASRAWIDFRINDCGAYVRYALRPYAIIEVVEAIDIEDLFLANIKLQEYQAIASYDDVLVSDIVTKSLTTINENRFIKVLNFIDNLPAAENRSTAFSAMLDYMIVNDAFEVPQMFDFLIYLKINIANFPVSYGLQSVHIQYMSTVQELTLSKMQGFVINIGDSFTVARNYFNNDTESYLLEVFLIIINATRNDPLTLINYGANLKYKKYLFGLTDVLQKSVTTIILANDFSHSSYAFEYKKFLEESIVKFNSTPELLVAKANLINTVTDAATFFTPLITNQSNWNESLKYFNNDSNLYFLDLFDIFMNSSGSQNYFALDYVKNLQQPQYTIAGLRDILYSFLLDYISSNGENMISFTFEYKIYLEAKRTSSANDAAIQALIRTSLEVVIESVIYIFKAVMLSSQRTMYLSFFNNDTSSALTDLFQIIVNSASSDYINTFDIVKLLQLENYRFIGFQALWQQTHSISQPITLLVAYQIKEAMIGASPVVYNDYNALVQGYPVCVQAIMFSSRANIKNNLHGDFMYSPDGHDYDSDRKFVFDWIPGGNVDTKGLWRFDTFDEGNTFEIYSIYSGQYLYPASDYFNHDSDRRSVFTSRSGNRIIQGKFTIDIMTANTVAIKSQYYGEFLYASGITYDSDRRYVFTWIPGNFDSDAIWTVTPA